MTDDLGYLSDILRDLVHNVTYKPKWKNYIGYEVGADGSGGWHFFIISNTENSIIPGEMDYRVRHGFLIPAASYNRDNWIAWLFDRFRDVESHEAAEFFTVDGEREFAPHHGNGEDPYRVWHVSDLATAKKRAGDD